MSTLKKSLYLLIPLSLVIVASIIYSSLHMVRQGPKEPLSYSTTSIGTGETKYQDIYQNTSSQTQKDIGTTTSITSWQDSSSIKHADYIAQIASTTDTEVFQTAPAVAPETETSSTNDSATTFSDIWGWIPSIHTEIPTVTQEERPEQGAIRSYANAFGIEIKKFANSTGDQPQIMNEFMAGRGILGNATALMQLSKKYKDVGALLTTILISESVPSDVRSKGLALADAYSEVGEATQALAAAESTDDTATVDSIYTYHSSVDTFAQRFISFSNIIGAYGVTFTQGEGGDILVMPQ